jgi:integrase
VTDMFEWRPEVGIEGALSLRFLQEPALSLSKERVAMLPTQLLSVLHQNPLPMRSWYPPFAKNREGRVPSCVGDASEIKKPGHSPGVDLRTVQDWMGHTDLSSTLRYLKPNLAVVQTKVEAIWK